MEEIKPMATDRLSYQIQDFTDPQTVFDALDRRDDQSIWHAAKSAPSQAAFYEQLRAQVGYATFHHGTSKTGREGLRHHCAMLLTPLILPPSNSDTLFGETLGSKKAITTISAWIGRWLGYKSEVSLVSTPIGYSEICTWTPSEMREILDTLVAAKKFAISTPTNQSLQEKSLRLPEDSPRLMFIVGYIQSPLAWPTLPPANDLEDMRLTEKISAAMQFCSNEPGYQAIVARPPCFASEALIDGIINWISAIHAHNGITRWDVEQVDLDVANLYLEVGEYSTHTSVIPLRAHQLGIYGVQSVLMHVAKLGTGLITTPQ